MKSKSKYVRKGPCPECGSKDNLVWYDDGHAHCFGCPYKYQPNKKDSKPYTPYTFKKPIMNPFKKEKAVKPLIPKDRIVYKALPKRGVTQETAKFWDYGLADYNGSPVQVATYKDHTGKDVAQHLRFKDKKFIWLGDISKIQLWGQHLWRQTNQGQVFCVVAEGEIDAMSISQIQGNKFPVVSLPSGAQSASKYLVMNELWLAGHLRTVLCFDNDKAGDDAAIKATEVLAGVPVAIARLREFKDANEMLLAGKGEELRDLLWKAIPVKPEGIRDSADCWDEVIKKGADSICTYPWPKLNHMMRGIRRSEMNLITAGSGTGKSSMCRELAHHFLTRGLKVGYIALEESIQRSLQGIIAVDLSKPIHLDSSLVEEEELRESFDRLCSTHRLHLYDHFGSMDPDTLCQQIQYLAKVEGVDVVFVDHITIVVSGLDNVDERRSLDITVTKLRQMVEATGITLFLVSHLKRPEGRGHEEGTKVSLSHLRGSHSLAQLCDGCISASRNQQGDAAERSELQLAVLKNRHSGSTGEADKLLYSEQTGRLSTPLFN
tara:strand:+ start:1908 stop:3548 length:1641 start_codon:yes stop_codon:yes gene_type:complete